MIKTPEYIRKRDGLMDSFNSERINSAITRAGVATGEFAADIAKILTDKVIAVLGTESIQDIESIQDVIERVLLEEGYNHTARGYIVYREQHARLRTERNIQIDVISSIEEYLNRADWRVNANANQGYSLGGLILNSAGKMIANYWLSHVYPPEIGDAHREADFHIHDLDFLAGYCAGWSLRMLLQEGLNGVPGKIEAAPPKHMSSAIGQIVNFLGTLQNEWAGAQAFSSFDTYIAPYVRVDKLNYSHVKQNIQELIYNLNVPSRWGNQTPFTNLTFDWVCPEDLINQVPIIGGKEVGFTYGDLQYEMDLINKAYIEVMTEGDSKGRIFTFPIPTYNITNEFPWNSENADILFNMTAKFGLPYFQNFISSELKPNMVRSMCLFSEEKILFKEHERISNITIGNLFAEYASRQLDSEWYECASNVTALSLNPHTGKFEWAKITKFLRVTDNKLVSINTKDGKLMRLSANHLVAVLTCQGIETKKAYEVKIGDFVLVVKNASANLNQTVASVTEEKLAGQGLTNDRIEWLRHSDFAVVAVRLVHIENLDCQQEFYDIELEKNHYFVHSDGNISHNCCRLQLDLRELLKRGNGLFGSSEQTGSTGVVTINCARLGYIFKNNITGLYERLDYLLELAKNSLEIKRKVIQRHIDTGLFPYTKRYLGTLRNHFSTIGVNGINEMIRNFTNDNENITTTNGHEIAAKLLDHIRAKMIEFQEATGHMYNLEATPAEGTTYRFAKEDQKRFNGILQAGTKEAPYYTNSSQLPVGYTTDAFQALEMQEDLQAKYTGGCVEKGTKVITDKGSFNIEEIIDNFKSLSPIHALSYNLNIEQSEWDLITNAMSVVVSQNDKIRVVAEKGLNIVTSDWHPFFVLQKIPFAGICLTCGTELASVKGLPSHFRTHQECKFAYQNRQPYEVIEKRADQLLVGDYILQNATNMFAEKIGIDDDLVYLMGFFISNGSISKTIDDRGGNALERFIVRFFSEHQSVLDKVANILNKHFDCCVSIRQGDKRSNKLFIVSTNKKSVCDFLFDYGFHSGVKAYTVHIPIKLQQCLFESSFYALLSGLIDGDGHISKRYGDIEYSTVSKQLAADIVMLCNMAGIAVGMYEHPTYRPNEVTGYRVLFPASVVTRMKDRLSIQNDKNYIKDNLSNRKKRLLPVVRVLSTDKISVEDNLFYDLTTKKNHNYLAGNNSFVFIHNTVLHLYMGERISNSEACKKLIKRALERFRVPYLTISPTFSICPVHGYINGEHKFCPVCDEVVASKKFIKSVM